MSRFDEVRNGIVSLNLTGSMTLFEFQQPTKPSNPVAYSREVIEGYAPNPEQQVAIIKSLSQEVTFIWGPPGTGKTKTLGIILNQLIRAGKSVLITSHTNAAVDEILNKFIETEENHPYLEADKILRIGIPSDDTSPVNKILIDTIVEKRTVNEQKQVEELQKSTESLHEAIQQIKSQEHDANTKHVLLTSHTGELEKLDIKIDNLQRRSGKKISQYNETTEKLVTQRELHERAKTTNAIKRFLLGLNLDTIEREIESLNAVLERVKVERQIQESTLRDVQNQKDKITKKRTQLQTDIEQILAQTGFTSLKSFKHRIHDLSQVIRQNGEELQLIRERIREIRESTYNNALAIGCTLTRAYLDPRIIKRKFDVLILDEASMAPLPNVFFADGLVSGQTIVSGDFRQLPPISVSDDLVARKWLRRDIFEQAGIVESVDTFAEDHRLVMLREQYRMHPDICDLVSQAMYDGMLKTSETVRSEKQRITALPPMEDQALIFCDTTQANPWLKRPRTSKSRLSPYSAIVSARLASTILQSSEENGIELNVGIVSPYTAQSQLITKILEDQGIEKNRVMAATIHKFQGNERDCIIFDLVEGPPFPPGILTKGPFNSEQGKLINVAISRAEGKFILVGNGSYIRSRFTPNDAVYQLMSSIEDHGITIDSLEILSSSFELGSEDDLSPRTGRSLSSSFITLLDEKNFYDTFRQDLNKAQNSVVIFSPFLARSRVHDLLDAFQGAVARGIRCYIVTRHPNNQSSQQMANELIEVLRKQGVKVITATKTLEIHERFHDKIAVIDTAVFYHGSMNILSQNDTSESMIAFRTPRTIKELVQIFDIQRIVRTYQLLTGETTPQQTILRIVEEKLLEHLYPGTCPRCNTKLRLVNAQRRLFLGCPNMLEKGCTIQRNVQKRLIQKAVTALKLKCEECANGHMVYREGKRGPFLGCNQYSSGQCKSTYDVNDYISYANSTTTKDAL